MIEAYKYMNLENGLLFLFEKGMTINDASVPIRISRINDRNLLQIGDAHIVTLDADTYKILHKTKRIYIAESGVFDTKIEIQGVIEIADISAGEIMAYVEKS